MNNRTIFINFFLIAFIIFEGFNIVQLWYSKDSLPGKMAGGPVTPEKFEPVKIFREKTIPISAYNEIIQKNLFSPERKEYIKEVIQPEIKPEPEVKPEAKIIELDTNKITLFGVVIMGDLKKALVTDVGNNKKNTSIWVQKGDTIDVFTVESIEKDKLIVSNQEKKYAVLLYDDKKSKEREIVNNESDKKTTPIVTKIIIPQPEKPVVVRPEPVEKPVTAPDVMEKPVVPPDSKEADNGEDDIISTPFGDFKRIKE